MIDISELIIEAEEERQIALEQYDDYWPGKHEFTTPGSCAMHEALDRAALVRNMLETALLEHPSIVMNKEWYTKAWIAFSVLFELYDDIAYVHMEIGDD